MGTGTSSCRFKKNELSDREFIELHCSSIFNDDFVSRLITDSDEKLKLDKKESSDSNDANISRFHKTLANIIVKSKVNKVHEVSSVIDDKSFEITTPHPLTTILKKRDFLVNRIHESYVNQARQSRDLASLVEGFTLSGHSFCKNVAEARNDPSLALVVMNINMFLSVVDKLGVLVPELATSVSDSLVGTLAELDSSLLRRSEFAPSLVTSTVSRLFDFARRLESTTVDGRRSNALQLMLTLAKVTGSVEFVVETAAALLRGPETLPEKYNIIIDEILAMQSACHLTAPLCDNIDQLIKVPFGALPESTPIASQSVAASGAFYFVWDVTTGSIRKFGSGFGRSIIGEQMGSNEKALSQIKNHEVCLAQKEVEKEEEEQKQEKERNHEDSAEGSRAESSSVLRNALRIDGIQGLSFREEDTTYSFNYHAPEEVEEDDGFLSTVADNPFSRDRQDLPNYFEVEFFPSRVYCIAVVLSTTPDRVESTSAMEEACYGVAPLSGDFFNSDSDSFQGLESDWEPLETGIVGIGVDRSSNSIFVTRNGQLFGNIYTNLEHSQFWPMVSIGYALSVDQSLRYRTNFGERPFAFRGAGLQREGGGASSKRESDSSCSENAASMAVVGGTLFVRVPSATKRHVAMFNSKSLQLEALVRLDFDENIGSSNALQAMHSLSQPIPASTEAENLPSLESPESLEASISRTIFEFGELDPVCIRCLPHQQLSLGKCFLDDEDVSEAVASRISPCERSLFIPSVGELFPNGQTSSNQPRKFVVAVSAHQVKEVQQTDPLTLHFPMTTDGKRLLLLTETSHRVGASLRVPFDFVRGIHFRSARFHSDPEGSEGDVLNVVAAKWIECLGKWHDNSKASITSVVDCDWLGDPQHGYRKCLFLTIEFTHLDGRSWSKILSYAENSTLDWSYILQIAEYWMTGLQTELSVAIASAGLECKVIRTLVVPLWKASLCCSWNRLNRGTSISTNGKEILFQQILPGQNRQIKCGIFEIPLQGNELQLRSEFADVFPASEFVPGGLCFDVATNTFVGFSGQAASFARWRNFGLLPALRSEESSMDRLSRIAVNQGSKSSEVVSALLMATLEQLADPYGPSGTDGSNPTAFINEIEIQSKSQSGGSDGFCSLRIAGEIAVPETEFGRCYNIVVLSPDLKILETQSFDTSSDAAVTARLTSFLNKISPGVFVAVCTKFAANSNMSKVSWEALRRLGFNTRPLENSPSTDFLPFSGLGWVGAPPEKAFQVIAASGAKATLRVKKPSADIPLKVETTPPLFSALIRFMQSLWKEYSDQQSNRQAIIETILLSTFRLLEVNAHQLREVAFAGALTERIAPEFREILRQTLLEIMERVEPTSPVAEAALSTFVTVLDLLYPTTADHNALLNSYLQKHAEKQGLSSKESKILHRLMTQASTPESLHRMVNGSEDEIKNLPTLLTAAEELLNHEINEKLKLIAAKTSSSALALDNSLIDGAVHLVAGLSKMLLSKSADLIVSSDTKQENVEKSRQVCSNLLSMACTLIESCAVLFDKAIVAVSDGTKPNECDWSGSVDEVVRSSLSGELLPFFLTALSALFNGAGSKIVSWFVDQKVSLFSNFSAACSRLQKKLSAVCRLLPEELQHQAPIVSQQEDSTIVESDHPYENNMNGFTEYAFPGASKLTIVFDPASRTENGCDYVRFLTESRECLHPSIQKFSGRDGNQNWPGCEGRPPLELIVDRFFLEFISDGSVNDWGFKFTITAEYPAKNKAKDHWIVQLDRQLQALRCSVACAFYAGIPWNEALEGQNTSWMRDPLFTSDMFTGEPGTSEGDVLLNDLVEHPEGSLAAELIMIMKSHVREDQGTDQVIDRAVYATCAALIKHNNLTPEAVALATHARKECSSQFLRTWTAGQKMRSYFYLSDLRDADVKTLVAASDKVVERALMLLREPAVSSTDVPQPLALTRQRSTELPPRPPSLVKSKSFLAKQRWGLLGKFDSRSVSTPISPRSQKRMSWSQLVSDVVVSEGVKKILEYRRKAAAKKNAAQSTTEKILAFVQSKALVEDLEKTSHLRSQRAFWRAHGVLLVAECLDSSVSPVDASWVLETFLRAMRGSCDASSTAITNDRLHFEVFVEGAATMHREQLFQAYSAFIEKCTSILETAEGVLNDSSSSEKERSAWSTAVTTCLRALALDYSDCDHAILGRTSLVAVLDRLANCSDEAIRVLSTNLFEHLLSSCWSHKAPSSNATSIGLDYVESSEFSNAIFNVLSSRLKGLSSSLSVLTTIPPSNHKLPSREAISILSGVRVLDQSSYCHPSVAAGLKQSISIWVYRPRSGILDSAASSSLVGKRVIRGNSLHSNDDLKALSPFLEGVIASEKENGTVYVKWFSSTGKSVAGWYTLGPEPDKEVHLSDESLAGLVFSKGAPGLLGEEETTEKLPAWSAYGLEVLGDASVNFFATSGARTGNFSLRSSMKIPLESWTHLCVVLDQTESRLFVNEKFEGSKPLPETMTNPRAQELVKIEESDHPYANNSNYYRIISFPGATRITIKFDPRSRSENNYDYVTFFKSSDHSEYWGQEKYTGTTPSNYPGVEGCPPLVISADNVHLHFRSDASNNDWGYLITFEADRCDSSSDAVFDESRLNSMPFFIGQPQVMCGKCSASKKEFSGLVADFSVAGVALSNENVLKFYNELKSTRFGLSPASTAQFSSIARIPEQAEVLSQLLQGVQGLIRSNWTSSTISNTIFSPQIAKSLLRLFSLASSPIRLAALRLCELILPRIGVGMVDDIANDVFEDLGLTSAGESESKFIAILFHFLSAFFSRFCVSALPRKAVEDVGSAHAMAEGVLSLLRSLSSCEEEDWRNAVLSSVHRRLEKGLRELQTISTAAGEELSAGLFGTAKSPVPSNQAAEVLGVLSFLGGFPSGIYMGSTCAYRNPKGLTEECVVLGPNVVPKYDPADKDSISLFKEVESFGQAFAVAFVAQPSKPMIVPLSRLFLKDVSEPAAFSKFLETQLDREAVVELFKAVLLLQSIDTRPVLLPITRTEDMSLHFESTHPYGNDESKTTLIEIPGAKSITITFDSASRTEKDCDIISFRDPKNEETTYGEVYSGRDGSQNWPGCEGREPLVIPADSVMMKFTSDASNTDWGYSFTASGTSSTKISPPPSSHLHSLGVLRFVKMIGTKAFLQCLRCLPSAFVPRARQLMPVLITNVLSPDPCQEVDDQPKLKPVDLESKHPYDDNMDSYTTVRIPGAKKLSVSFDPQTRTENNCDYVRFYTDSTHTALVDDSTTYTGGKDGNSSNWPGMQDRPPLVVHGDNFVVYFHSDGSVNDWGWKMTVTPIGDTNSSSFNTSKPEALALQHYYLQSLAYCDVKSRKKQQTYDAKFLRQFESKPAALFNNHMIDLNDINDSNTSPVVTSCWNLIPEAAGRCFVASIESIDAINIPILDKFEDDSTPPTEIGCITSCEQTFVVEEERGEWLRGRIVLAEGTEVFGWARRRDGNRVFLRPSLCETPTEQPIWHETVPEVSYPEIGSVVEVNYRESGVRVPAKITGVRSLSSFDVLLAHGEILTNVPREALSLQPSTSASENQVRTSALFTMPDGSASMAEGDDSTVDPLPTMRSNCNSIQLSLFKLENAAIVGYVRDTVRELIRHQNAVEPPTVEEFGGLSKLLSYFNSFYGEDETVGVTAVKHYENLLTTLCDPTVEGGGQNVGEDIVQFAWDQFSRTELETHWKKEHVCRAYQRVIETPHPFQLGESIERVWLIKFPGAAAISLTFDPRCDVPVNNLEVLSESGESLWKNTGEYWPCRNSCSPVVFQQAEITVKLQIDGTDAEEIWGLRIVGRGILDQGVLVRCSVENCLRKVELKPSNAALACWFLKTLYHRNPQPLQKLLFSRKAFSKIRSYFENFAIDEVPLDVVTLLSDLLVGISRSRSRVKALLPQIRAMSKIISQEASRYYDKETAKGSNLKNISNRLQSFVQLALNIDNIVESSAHGAVSELQSPSKESPSTQRNADSNPKFCFEDADQFWITTDSCAELSKNGHVLTVRRIDFPTFCAYAGKSCVDQGAWNIRLNRCHGKVPSIGVSLKSSDFNGPAVAAWGEALVFQNGSQEIKFGPKVQEGDVVSIRLNVEESTLSFHRNGAFVGLAMGPPGSGAIQEGALCRGEYVLRVDMFEVNDEVELLTCPLKLEEAVEVATGVPAWLKGFQRSIALMKESLSDAMPAKLAEEQLVPACMAQSTSTTSIEGNCSREIFEEGASFLAISLRQLKGPANWELAISSSDGKLLGSWKQSVLRTAEDSIPSIVTSALARIKQFKDNVVKKEPTSLGVGDEVVRGENWSYENEDGRVGSIGIVKERKDWEEGSGARDAVVVEWTEKNVQGLYRYTQSGKRDVRYYSTSSQSFYRPVEHLFVEAGCVLAIVPGPSAVIELRPSSDGSDDAQEAECTFTVLPYFDEATLLSQERFQPLVQFLRDVYCTGQNLQVETALSRHIDAVMASKSINLTSLWKSDSKPFVPTPEDIARSPVLGTLSLDKIKPPAEFSSYEPGTASTEAPIVDRREECIFTVSTNGVLGYSGCAKLARDLGARLPSREEASDYLNKFDHAPIYDRDMWWPLNEQDTWLSVGNYDWEVRLGRTHTEMFGVPGWNEDLTYRAERTIMAIMLPRPSNCPNCKKCDQPTILSDYCNASYRGGWYCNSCRASGRSFRWLCFSCKSDYCFRCVPSEAVVPSEIDGWDCDSGDWLVKGIPFLWIESEPLQRCATLEEAKERSTELTVAIVFDPERGTFNLHADRNVSATNLPVICFLRKSAFGNGLSAPSTTASEQAAEVDEELLRQQGSYRGPFTGMYLEGYATFEGESFFGSLEEALAAGQRAYPDCRGITYEPSTLQYTLRQSSELMLSPSGEDSYLLNPPTGRRRRFSRSEVVLEGDDGLEMIGPRAGMALRGNVGNEMSFEELEDACTAAFEMYPSCRGITFSGGRFYLRASDELEESDSGEISYIIHDQDDDDGDDDDMEADDNLEEVSKFDVAPNDINSVARGPYFGFYLSGYVECENYEFDDLSSALEAGVSLYPNCRGVTFEPRSQKYTLRRSGEDSARLLCSPWREASYLIFDNNANAQAASVSGPHQCCSLSGDVDYDGPSEFDTFEEAVAAAQALFPACRGVTHSTETGKYVLKRSDRLTRVDQSFSSFVLLGSVKGSAARGKGSPKTTQSTHEHLEKSPFDAKFELLRDFNNLLQSSIYLFDLNLATKFGTAASLLCRCRGMILAGVKNPLWEEALRATAGSGGQFELRLSRSRARKFAASGQCDHDGRYMVFSQAFRQMHSLPSTQLRRGDKLYNCMFMGERAQDAGGPYRESFGMYTQELQSSSLPLLLPTPNGRHAVGVNREKWVLHPGSTSDTHLQMFEFVGKLMGIAIRSKDYLDLNLPSLIWKLLVNDIPTVEDLEGIDLSLVTSLTSLREIEKDGITPDSFNQVFFETFSTTTTDDRIVELVPGGASKEVTFANRNEYCDLVLQYRLHEFDVQAKAVLRGLSAIVPTSLLSIFTWNQLEVMVCGQAAIDVGLLERIAEYSSCGPTDKHVRFFWQAMREFTNEERSALIRFTWGRSRLPLDAAGFTQRFKLQSFNQTPADAYLPVAHTCFFSLELPAYSSLEVMKEKLRYAIFNCLAIDGDDTGTGMAVAAMGWED